MDTTSLHERAGAVRRFNRFYTRVIGVLNEGLLGTPLGLTEARILFEISHHDNTTAKILQADLGIDPGYMSRILGKFERQGLVEKTRSTTDSRQRLLNLTPAGHRLMSELDTKSQRMIENLMNDVPLGDQNRLVEAMGTIETILDPAPPARAPVILRTHRPGDIGWVIERHAEIYGRDYGWNEHFVAVVIEILAAYVKTYDPRRDGGWIAERDGRRVGSLFLARETDDDARLRLLLVEPQARGLGLGQALVEESIRFARRAGYRRILLWTMASLVHARRIYETCGFVRTAREPCDRFGKSLVSETWELKLNGNRS